MPSSRLRFRFVECQGGSIFAEKSRAVDSSTGQKGREEREECQKINVRSSSRNIARNLAGDGASYAAR